MSVIVASSSPVALAAPTGRVVECNGLNSTGGVFVRAGITAEAPLVAPSLKLTGGIPADAKQSYTETVDATTQQLLIRADALPSGTIPLVTSLTALIAKPVLAGASPGVAHLVVQPGRQSKPVEWASAVQYGVLTVPAAAAQPLIVSTASMTPNTYVRLMLVGGSAAAFAAVGGITDPVTAVVLAGAFATGFSVTGVEGSVYRWELMTG